MKKRLYKLLAFALSVCMVVGLMPAMTLTARAEDVSAEDTEWTDGDEIPTGGVTLTDGNYTVSGEIPVKGTITINGNVTIKGDGTLKRDASFEAGSVIKVTGGTVTIEGVTLDGANISTTAENTHAIDITNGTVTLKATVQNFVNSKDNFGGGTVKISGGTLNIEEGALIQNNQAYDGAAILLHLTSSGDAKINMTGGEITGNRATGYCGGIYVAPLDRCTGTLNMSGGKISGNYAPSGGAGVMLHTNGAADITGGEITGNGSQQTANGTYGPAGVWLYNTGTKLTVGGTAKIYGNMSGSSYSGGLTLGTTNSNLYLATGATLTIGETTLADGANIWVGTQANATDSADVKIATGAQDGDYKYFHSDKATTAGVLYCGGDDSHSPINNSHHSSHTAGDLYLSTVMKAVSKKLTGNNMTFSGEHVAEDGTITLVPGADTDEITITPAEGYMLPESVEDLPAGVTYTYDAETNTATLKIDTSYKGDSDITITDAQKAEAKVVTGEDGATKYYRTASDALTNATDGQTVEIVGDTITAAEGTTVTSGVTVKGKDGTEFKTGEDVQVSVDVSGSVTVKAGTVEVGNEKKVKAGDGTEYTAKADNTSLSVAEGKTTLESGSVEVPASGKITVNGKEVTAGEAAVTVTKGKPDANSAQVEIPDGKKATIGGVEYTGEATVVLDADGNASVAKGTVNLPSSDGGTANGETNVDFGDGKSVHVKNAAQTDGKDVEVKVPVSGENTNGQATVKKGGAVQIGEKTYNVPEDAADETNVFEFDKDGKVKLTDGAVELDSTGDGAANSVGFGNTTITGTNGTEEANNKVKVVADGEKATVTVPKGGSVEIGGTTYTNTGDGELELEVDAEGNVTLKTDTVENSKVQVSDGGSLKVGDNTYTAKGNATIEAAKEATEGTLTEGTVALGENSKVKTKSAGQDVTVSGSKGLEVTAGGAEAEGAKAKVKGTGTDGDSVIVEKDDGSKHSYALESGDTAEHEISSEGVIAGLAEELAKGGSTNGSAYGVKRDSAAEGNVYTLTDEDGTIHVTANASSKFTYGEQPAYTSVGTYEVPEGKSASLTADQEGNITLTEGTVKVGKGSGESGTLYVEGIDPEKGKISGDGITVTAPGTDSEGADVEVPNDGKVTIGDKKYTAKEEGTKLHVDEDGTVTLVEGSIEIPEGQTFEMDGVEYTGKVTVKKEAESGTATATFGAGSTGSIKNGPGKVFPGTSGDTLTVNNGLITGTISNGGKVTNNDGDYVAETSADVTVTPRGNVTLNEGSIKTPEDGGNVKFTTGSDEPADEHIVTGDGVTVTKSDTTGTVSVPQNGEATIDGTTYKNAGSDKALEIEVGGEDAPTLNEEKLPTLKSGAVELDNGEAIGVNGATVETTGDKVTVTKDSDDDGKATVDIPEGAKAKINGVEVEGPAKVEIDSSGNATVTPTTDGGTVTVGGVKYKDAPETEGKVTITADGDVSAENMAPSISAPTDGPVFVPEGTSVSFEVDGKTTVITGGEGGGYITVDGSGKVAVTDESGAANYGTYSNASDDDLRLTISSNEEDPATLTGGTVHAEKDSPVKVGEHTYTPGDDGMTLTYGEEAPTLTDGSVVPDKDAPVKVGDNTYTPQSNNVEIGMGTGNGSVKSNDGEDAQVQFQHNSEGAKDYLIPGTADAVSGTDDKLPSPAQEKLGTSDTNLGSDESGAKIKGDEGNTDGKNAYFESKEAGGGNLTLQPGAKATVTPAGDEAGSKATTYENADPEKDAKLTLDSNGNATLTDGKVKMTGEGAEGKGASVTVNGNTITSKDATVTAPGKNAEGEEETGSADVKVPASGSVEIGGKTYSNAGSDELELHVDKDGNVSVKSGKVELADDSSIKYGNTDITNPEGGEGNVTVEATEDKATVTVPTGEGNSVDIGGKEYKNAGDGDLKLEVAPVGEVYLNSGKVQVQDGASVTLPVNDGFQHFVAGDDVTVEKTAESKYKVTVPANGSAVFNSFEIKDHSGSGIELEITTNGAALTNGSADIGTNMELTVSGAKVENAGPGDVTVEKTADGGEITIPDGTTATVNGVEVKGPAKVTVGNDGKATVKPEPAGAGKSVTVGGVTYTDTSEDGRGKVEISKDGKVTAENMSAAIEKLPVEGLVVPAGQTFTYKAGGKDVTLKGGASDSTIDIDSNGDITMESGNLTIKGDVTTKKADDASEDTKWQYVGDVTLKLTDEDGKALTKDQVTGKLTVKKANGEVAGLTDDQIVVNDDGTVTLKDVPYGSYTVEVEGATGKKTTTTVTVNGASTTSSMTVETEITVTTEVSGSASMAPNAAENLEDEVKPADRDKAGEDDVEVTITLNVADASTGKDTEKEAIDAEVEKLLGASGSATDAVTDYVDVTVSKEVTVGGVKNNDLSEDNISNTSSLITMRFPLSTSLNGKLTGGVTAENIFVFRYHDGSAAKMRKVSPGAGKTANFECYYIEVSPDSTGSITVVVKANKFSVYAFGVADSAILPQDPSTGGGGVVAYPVTLPESVDNGTVSANYSSAAPGVTVTLTVTPDDGYTMGSITITDRNGNIIPVTDNGDGTYSFRMPSGGVEVSISFKLSHCDGGDDCPSRAFPDLDVTAWYHEYTDYVIETKLMQGSGGLFKPNGTLTRAEMVTVLWNMNGRGVVNYLMTYGDVSEEDWYAEAIRWATSEGVVDGYDNGNFGPNDKITREQMAKMLYNYEKKYGDGGFTGEWMFPLPFADTAKINDWAYEAVAWCYMNGVINGKDGNVFDPAGNALRCELAKVLTVYNQIDD